MGEWSVHNLEDCMEAIIDYRGKTPEKTKSGIPLITAKVVKGGRIEPTDEYIAAEDYDSWMRRGLPKAGDVVMTTEAPLGEIAQLGSEQVALAQRLITLRGKQNLLDNRFLKFLMQSDDVQVQLRARASGTTVLGIKQSELRKTTLTLPPLDEQRAIAHILGTLDDKIELNRRMNETLEAMARALFKSWFVDFEPVRAKAEGRDTGLPKEIADLFPDSFEPACRDGHGAGRDSELGEVPKGWRVGRLDDVLVLQRGFDLPATQRVDGQFSVVAASGPSGTHNEYMVKGPGVTTGRSGVLGKVFYVHDDFWPLNTSLWVKEFRHSKPAYAFYSLQGLDFGIFNAGSAVPTLNRNHVHNLPTLMPPLALIDRFEAIAVSLLRRQKLNDNESRTLAAQRDALLPKLLSGEVRIKDFKNALI